MKHKLLASLALMLMSTLAHAFEVDGINYKFKGEEVEVTSSSFSQGYSGDVVIPETVTYNGKAYTVIAIGKNAFVNCSGLTSVEIPNSVTTIGNYAFRFCSSLTSIELPNSVTTIGNHAFSDCSGLTSIEIPSSVTLLDKSAFVKCSSLTSVKIPNSVTEINDFTFSGCSGLTSVEIPNSVISIGTSAFIQCSSLTSVEIPKSVTNIGTTAFSYCSNLKSIVVHNDNPIELGESVFSLVNTQSCVLYVPKGSKELYAAADQWKDFSNIVEMSASSVEAMSMGAANALQVRPTGNGIEVAGTIAGEQIGLYDANGALQYSGKAAGASTIIPTTMKKGMTYIIKVGLKSLKYRF